VKFASMVSLILSWEIFLLHKCKYTNNPWLGVWWTLVVVLYKAVSEFPAVNNLTSIYVLHS